MKHHISMAFCASFVGVAFGAVAITEPAFNDVFFALNSSGGLVPLERQSATIEGHAKFGGYGGIKVSSQFEPARSPVRFAVHPQFIVRSFAAGASIDPDTLYVLRVLREGSHKRELVMTESHGPLALGGTTSNLAEGIVPVTFEKIGQYSLKISPGALPPGEYALSKRFGMADLFCFGID
jgi:hypothetical protein